MALLSTFEDMRTTINCKLFYRNSSKLVLTVLLFSVFFSIYQTSSLSINYPRWLRMRRLVDNVDKFAEMVPLAKNSRLSSDFMDFVQKLKEIQGVPYVIFFDNSNLNVTFNHICNLEFFPGERERLTAVAFERSAEKSLNSLYPDIPTVTVDFTPLKEVLVGGLENRKYIMYQLILMLRSRISAAIAREGVNFWGMQQDSIWTTPFRRLDLDTIHQHSYMLFDTVGNDQFPIYDRMKGWVCGSTFFVRANDATIDFFEKIEYYMRHRMSPDSTIMTYLCGNPAYKCHKLPRNIVSSSNFFMGNRETVPAIIQIDHESKLSKMELFRQNGLQFMEDNLKCSSSSAHFIKDIVRKALPEVQQEVPEDKTTTYEAVYYWLKETIGFDPFNNKRFLRVHEGLV